MQPVQGLRPIFLVLSPAYKPLDNPKVRSAMTHAIDRDRIIKLVLEGNAYPLRGLLGPQVFGYDPDARAYPYDPEKAKQLLNEAGFANGFEIDYHSPTGRYPKDREVAQVIVEQLSKVGIKANLKTPEWSIFNTDYKNGKYRLLPHWKRQPYGRGHALSAILSDRHDQASPRLQQSKAR